MKSSAIRTATTTQNAVLPILGKDARPLTARTVANRLQQTQTAGLFWIIVPAVERRGRCV